MKVRPFIALLAVAVLPMSGCAGKPASTTGAVSDRPFKHSGALKDVTYVNPLPHDPLWDTYGSCLASEAKAHGITLHTVGPPGGNVNVQALQDLDSQAIANHTQGIVTWSGLGAAALDPLFARERANGGVVATLLSANTTTNQNFEVGHPYNPDEIDIQLAGIAKRPGPQYVGALNQVAAIGDMAAYVKEAARYPNVHIVSVIYDQGNFTDDVSLVDTLLTTHPEINDLIGYSGYPGLVTAIKEQNKIGKVLAFQSSDYPQTTDGYIQQNLLGGIIVFNACGAGKLVIDDFLKLWDGQQVTGNLDDGLELMTPEEFEHLPAGYI